MEPKEKHFREFCEILDDELILKKHSLLWVIDFLKDKIKLIKSDVLSYLSANGSDDYYLDYLINEIQRQSYLKDYDMPSVERWLKKLNLNLDQIEEFDFPIGFDNILDITLSPREYFENYDTINGAQQTFLYYFLKYYADQLIDFLKSKKTDYKPSERIFPKVNKSEEIAERLVSEIKDFNEWSATQQELLARKKESGDESYIPEEEEFNAEEISRKADIIALLDELYSNSIKDNYYYFDCPSVVYINNFDERRENYLSDLPDANELDFLLREVALLNRPYDYRRIYHNSTSVYYHTFAPYSTKLSTTLRRKFEFLNGKLNKYNKYLDIVENTPIKDDYTNHYWLITTAIVKDLKPNAVTPSKNLEVPKKFLEAEIPKIKWSGKKAHLGFIIGTLADLGYISAPEKPNGETNYTQFADLVLKVFECDTTAGTLSKYLNVTTEKSQEVKRNFESQDFYFPHSKEVS